MERNNEVIHWTKYVEKQRERTMCGVPVCNRTRGKRHKFPSVFHGLGCLKEPYRIKVDPTVTPVVNLLRSTPVAQREVKEIVI